MVALDVPRVASGETARRMLWLFEDMMARRRPVVVRYLDPMNTRQCSATGMPVEMRQDVIMVLVTPRRVAIIAKAQIVDITTLYPQRT